MTTPDHDHTLDPDPDPLLRQALSALPVERTPPPAVWEGISRAITQPAANAHVDHQFRVRRTTIRVALTGMAALLAIVVLTRRAPVPEAPVATVASAAADDDPLDPKVRAIRNQTQHWRDAVRDPVRSARWPAPTRAAIDRALDETERALGEARADLARAPQDPAARETVSLLRDQQLALLQHAMALLDEL